MSQSKVSLFQYQTFLTETGNSLKVGNPQNVPEEQLLFLSVILQAFLDATKPAASNEPEEEQLARRQAQAWFFASVGVTAEDFQTVCDMAGLDAGYVRSFAYKVLRTKEIKYERKRINTVLSHKD